MNYKLKKILKYLTINGIFTASLYYGFFVGIGWVANLATFLVIALTIICVLIMGIFFVFNAASDELNVDASKTFLEDNNNGDVWCFPPFVDTLFDVGVCLFLAGTGHVPLAICYLVQTLSCIVNRSLIDTAINNCREIVNNEDSDNNDNRLERLGLTN